MRGRLVTATALAAVVTTLGASSGHAAVSDQVTFQFTADEQVFVVPDGVRSLFVELVGGAEPARALRRAVAARS